jgi:hypothetical protein
LKICCEIMYGYEAFGTKYYGEGEAAIFVISEYPLCISISQADVYNITISVGDCG